MPVSIVGKRVGATPREFESRILRHADRANASAWQPCCRRNEVCLSFGHGLDSHGIQPGTRTPENRAPVTPLAEVRLMVVGRRPGCASYTVPGALAELGTVDIVISRWMDPA